MKDTKRKRVALGALLSCSLLFLGALPVVAEESTSALMEKIQTLEERISSIEEEKPSLFFKKGVVLQSLDQSAPFEMKINARMQFRYTQFSRNQKSGVFDDGTSYQIRDRSDFEIERGRLSFEGYALDPKLRYYINLDFDTDDNHDVKAHDFWFEYAYLPEHSIFAGKAFVPGSREWIDGSTSTHLIDRSMATSFFRPDRSLGVWAIGDLAEKWKYRAMVSNGFKTTDLESDEIDNDFTYALSLWGDLMGEYGKGRADLEQHQDLAVRVGTSFTYSPIQANPDAEPTGEADAVRMSNGKKLDSEGAYQDGLTITDYDLYLYAVDLSAKYQGFSINSEAYFRNITNIAGDMMVGDDSFTDKGAYVDVGYMIVPQTFEAVYRYSFINGDRSDSTENAFGVNYYVDGSHNNKLTLDASHLDQSPVSSSGPNYEVGQDGWMYRAQWQIAF